MRVSRSAVSDKLSTNKSDNCFAICSMLIKFNIMLLAIYFIYCNMDVKIYVIIITCVPGSENK